MGNANIRNYRTTINQQNVLRFYVTVNNPMLMKLLNSSKNFTGHTIKIRHRMLFKHKISQRPRS